jgi:hypothetical protein
MCGLSLALALAAVIIAGCSSSHHPAAAAKADSPTGTGPSRTVVAATAPGSSPHDSVARDCQVMTLNLGVLTKAATTPNDPSLDQGIAQLRQLHDRAPAEIKGDLQVIADFDQQVLDAVRSGGSPDAIRETPALTDALSHEARWVATHCRR